MTIGQTIALAYDAVEALAGDRCVLAHWASWCVRLVESDLGGVA